MATISKPIDIEFGKGTTATVMIYNGYDVEDEASFIMLEQHENCGVIGSVTNDPVDAIENPVVLWFYNPHSIDTLIERLQIAKKTMVDIDYRKEFLTRCK